MCDFCANLRYVKLDVPPSDPRWGKAQPCPVCEVPRQRRQRAERLRELAGVPEDLSAYTFARYRPEQAAAKGSRETLQRALEAAREYAEKPDGWLVLYGPPGIGKTHLAYGIVGRCLARGQAVYYGSWPAMLDTLRDGYQDNARIGYDVRMRTLCDVELLVVDDVGAESVTAWSNEKLFEIVNHRYTRRLPLVVTTNLRVADGNCGMEARIRSRLVDTRLSRVLVMAGADYRERRTG